MSLTLIIWCCLAALCLVGGLRWPILGPVLYIQMFFFHPHYWWWGKQLPPYRWSLIAAIAAAFFAFIAALSGRSRFVFGRTFYGKLSIVFAILMLLNASVVHLLLAQDSNSSAYVYWYMAKYLVLVILFQATCSTERDLKAILWIIILGAAYIGYEVTVNDRGKMIGGRLENVGPPGANASNSLASLMVTVLPLMGVFLLAGNKLEKAFIVISAPLVLNVILLCNSRGAFLGALAASVVTSLNVPRRFRARYWVYLGLAALAVCLLLGDPRIIQRFKTTFLPHDQRDGSAQGRLDAWKAALECINDYPLGTGGDNFVTVHGQEYFGRVGFVRSAALEIHNGYLTEACDWGLQGLMVKLAYFGCAIVAVFNARAASTQQTIVRSDFFEAVRFLLLGSFTALLVTSFFGDRFRAEWAYWCIALALALDRLGGSYDRLSSSRAVKLEGRYKGSLFFHSAPTRRPTLPIAVYG